ncbi:SMI1/KNR4 family protein [Microbulbifer sp. VAAF005]|uniref:SMI1/KNR4 family protein n=1 Tax=Microbulbifer sp. VAAF005 TaxID=3034230 RepID=UPI0024ACCAFF|nr:SMI1/KNR4 family protein [Microbulbifer sp. VAAF005]WHI47660.1 SMI1/KNR4 family protein [Microbulbifer sp. VAAF005]
MSSETLSKSWSRIHIWLKKNAPQIYDALNPPATGTEIEKLESVIGYKLPRDLYELYKIHNGIKSSAIANLVYGLQFLPISDVITNIELQLHYGKLPLKHADPGIKSDSFDFSTKRIPIGDDCSTCTLYVDLEADKNGSNGQIVLLEYDSKSAFLRSPSITNMYSQFASDLESGKYALEEGAKEDGIDFLEMKKEPN